MREVTWELIRAGRLDGSDVVGPVVRPEHAPAAIRAVHADPSRALKLGVAFADGPWGEPVVFDEEDA